MINPFCLPIRLGVKAGWQTDVRTDKAAECFPEPGGELRPCVSDHIFGEAINSKHVL